MNPKLLLGCALVLCGGLIVTKCQTNSNPQPSKPDIRLIQLKAEIGNARAQSLLGLAYLGGDGVSKDPAQAFYWFKKAAEQGDAWGEGGVGTAYINGEGVVKDEKEAFKWFMKAADQGFFPAQDQLGVLYMNGMGCEKDLIEAYKWFSLASQQGYQTAIDHRTVLAAGMTPDQIYEGFQRAKAFAPISQSSTNLMVDGDLNSNLTNTATALRTTGEMQAEVKGFYSNFIPMATNRMGTNFGPVAAKFLAKVETNVLSTLTNSAMAEIGGAFKFLSELKKQGLVPGILKDSHGDLTTGNMPLSKFQEAKYPFAVTFNFLLNGDTFTNHYTVLRPALGASWRLDKAWRTDTQGQTVNEWPVK